MTTTTTPTAERLLVRFDRTDGQLTFQVMTDVDDLPQYGFGPTEVRRFDRLDDAATYALEHNLALDALRRWVRDHDGKYPADTEPVVAAARAVDVDVAEAVHDEWSDLEAERFEQTCNRDITYGSLGEPYGATCQLDKGHDGPHEGDGIRWTGGGYAAGDPLPFHIITED